VPSLCCDLEVKRLRAKLAEIKGLGETRFNLNSRVISIIEGKNQRKAIEAVFQKEGFEANALSADETPRSPQPVEPQPSAPAQASTADSDPTLVSYHVPSMCCNMEVNHLRAKLAEIKGLGELSFNLNSRVISIKDGKSQQKAIEAVFQKAGFEANALSADETPAAKAPPWKRYIIATILAFLAEGCHWQGFSYYLVVAISILSFVLTGFEVYKEGLLSFKRLKLDMNALMSLAVTGAVLLGEVAEGAMVLALFSLAEALEDRSLSQARAAIASLLALTPDKATARASDGQWREIRAEEAPVGSIIQIRPGEKLPLDGRVLSGFTTINQAPVTGESAPVDKNPGDQVFAGTINGSGSIEYETTAVFQDSTLAKVAAFVEATEAQKAPVQRLVDRFAAYYTPAIFGLAFLVAILPPLYYGFGWVLWIKKALVLLVISCPCALVISVPVTILSGLAAAAKKGLIIKGGAVLEEGRKLSIIALDKTGTITTGQPRLMATVVLANVDEARANLLAASLASRSDHPVSRAIFESYAHKDQIIEAENFQAYPGKGVGARMAGLDYLLGNQKLLPPEAWAGSEAETVWRDLVNQGQTAVVLIEAGRPLAIFAVADSLKEESLAAIQEMKKLGLKTVMLTGDNEAVARSMARIAGVDRYYAELLPEDKAKVINELKKEGHVGMAGDGINDAPALVSANIGLAMAMMGTDVAIETAQIAIMDDKLSKIPAFARLARSVWNLVLQNFVIVFTVKAAFLILTMVGYTSMWMAIIADIGVCMAVVANGLRATRK
jgi:Cd2+/Zn2+-exporting ATPase